MILLIFPEIAWQAYKTSFAEDTTVDNSPSLKLWRMIKSSFAEEATADDSPSLKLWRTMKSATPWVVIVVMICGHKIFFSIFSYHWQHKECCGQMERCI